MNGIEKITARIRQDADADVAAIRAQAEAQAAQIRAQYEAQAKAQAEKAAESCRQAARQRLERLESVAEMEGKTSLLTAKQACIDQAFAKAREKLLTLPEADYVELLAKLAARSSVTGREEIVLNRRDREAVGAKVAARANELLAQAAAPELPAELKESKAGSILTKVVTGDGDAHPGSGRRGDRGRAHPPGWAGGGELRLRDAAASAAGEHGRPGGPGPVRLKPSAGPPRAARE